MFTQTRVVVNMTCDIETIRHMIEQCEGDGRKLAKYDPMQILFALQQLIREVDRVWTLHPELATHNWKGNK
jgi:hypothetical protein